VSRGKEKLQQRAEELRKLGSPMVTVHWFDLAELDTPDKLFQRTERGNIQVDILVNNAGYGVRGAFAKTNLDDELEMMQLNMVALTHLTKLYLPQMIRRGHGRIMQVASTAAFQPGPSMAVYYASKAYVLSFSQALANELQGTGVTVTALAPGPTRTGFQKRGVMEDSRLVQGQIADAASVALAGYRGLMSGKTLVIPGFANKLIPWVGRLSPRGMVTRVVRRLQERVPQH